MRTYKNPLAEQHYRNLLSDLSRFPLCFTYAGKQYSGFSPEYFSLLFREVTEADGKETLCQTFSFENTLTITLISSFYESHGFELVQYKEVLGHQMSLYKFDLK